MRLNGSGSEIANENDHENGLYFVCFGETNPVSWTTAVIAITGTGKMAVRESSFCARFWGSNKLYVGELNTLIGTVGTSYVLRRYGRMTAIEAIVSRSSLKIADKCTRNIMADFTRRLETSYASACRFELVN